MLEWKVGACRFRLHLLSAAAVCFLLFTPLREILLPGLLAAVLHEGGHLLVMLLCAVPPRLVVFYPFGVVIREQSSACRSYKKDALVALGGPAANGLAALVCLVIFGASSPLIPANLALGAFNLLPAESLDGGRALYSLCCVRMLPAKAERIAARLTFWVMLPVAAAGLWVLLRSRGNFTLLLSGVYLMLCPVLKRRDSLLREPPAPR